MQTLPLSEAPRSATASEFLRRVLRFQHMDFEYTVWQMLYLCVNPTRIYRTTTYHSRTKHQWARDEAHFNYRWVFRIGLPLATARMESRKIVPLESSSSCGAKPLFKWREISTS